MARDSETTKSDRQLIEETAQRARRIETRVTQIANHLGIDHGGERPELRGSRLVVPSIKTSLEDALRALGGQTGLFSVYCGEDYLGQIAL